MKLILRIHYTNLSITNKEINFGMLGVNIIKEKFIMMMKVKDKTLLLIINFGPLLINLKIPSSKNVNAQLLLSESQILTKMIAYIN